MSSKPEKTASSAADPQVSQGPYALFMLSMCVIALAFLFVQVGLPIDDEVKQILDWADLGLCAVFFADFLYQLIRSTDRSKYMRTWGIVDLVSSIPVVGFLRVGRFVRIARLLRVLRGVRSARMLLQFTANHRRESAALGAFLIAALLIVCSSIAILQFEDAPKSNIRSAADAVWWSVTTMSTVGYGDFYPVTLEGRIVAVILMCGGVGVFGTVSALMATWLLKERAGQE